MKGRKVANHHKENWPPEEFKVRGGPQDGARVFRDDLDVMPQTIWLTSCEGNFRDGAAWNTKEISPYIYRYVLDAYTFVYQPIPVEPRV
jgi:hypothetical protein